MHMGSIAIPSLGSLLGSTGSASLLASINNSVSDSTFYGAMEPRFAQAHQRALETYVRPILIASEEAEKVSIALINPDVIRPLITFDDFVHVPPSMILPIVMYEPVRKLMEQGRIYGWDLDPDHLPEEDVYGRLIKNGLVESFVTTAQEAEGGHVEWTYTWRTSDPYLTLDEIDAVKATRDMLDEILSNTTFDPTNYPTDRC